MVELGWKSVSWSMLLKEIVSLELKESRNAEGAASVARVCDGLAHGNSSYKSVNCV